MSDYVTYPLKIKKDLWIKYKNKVPRAYSVLNDHLNELIKKFVGEK